MAVDPTREQIKAFAALDPNIPITMVNLLKFRDAAAYPAETGFEPCSGREAYARYTKAIIPFLAAVGGRIVYAGEIAAGLIGAPGEAATDWDKVLLVHYPSRKAFLDMVMNPDYQRITVHRTAALSQAALMQGPSA